MCVNVERERERRRRREKEKEMAQAEDYARKCEGVGEIAVMEAAGSGRSLKKRAMEAASSEIPFKRRKLNSDGDDKLVIRCYNVNSPASSENSDRAPVSRCQGWRDVEGSLGL